jgi:hypothetical protein
LNSNSQCQKDCVTPCAACSGNDPTVCT